MSSIELKFDEKSQDALIWNGQVVMSRTEETYFQALFSDSLISNPILCWRLVMALEFQPLSSKSI